MSAPATPPRKGPFRRQYDIIDRMVARAREGHQDPAEVGDVLLDQGLHAMFLADYCMSWGQALRGGYQDPRPDPQP